MRSVASMRSGALTLALLACFMVAAPAAAQSSAAPLVVGQTFTLHSNALNETRRINVYIPPACAEKPATRCPVLYMPDGGMAEDFLHVAGLVQVSTGNGTMRPFMLVGIENTQRRRDLTGPTENADDKKIAPVVGGSAAFRRFIRDELMPVIKARYRTTGETAIIGESLAGLFIVETYLLEPDLFDTYIAFDPSLWWNSSKLLDGAAVSLHNMTARKHTLYFASSSEPSMIPLTDRFEQILKQNAPPSLQWFYQHMTAETHATIYHPAALLALRQVFPVVKSK